MSLRDDIARHEGLRLVPYRDTTGYWTIGRGHKISDNRALTWEQACLSCGSPWSVEDAEQQLDADIAATRAELARHLPEAAGYPEAVQDILIEMAFQMGVAGLLKFRDLLGCCSRGDWAGARLAALDSLWARQTPQRAREIATKFLRA